MAPILTFSDKRLDKYKKTHGMYAVNSKGQKRIFRIGELPDGWKFVRSIRLDVSGLTLSEVISKMNKQLVRTT